MKALLALIVSVILFLIGWLTLSMILFIIQNLAVYARQGLGLFHFIHSLFTWIIAPCFGAFVGVYVSARIFGSISVVTIRSSFVSVVSTIIVLASLFSLVFDPSQRNLFDVLVVAAQMGAIVLGAKLGKDWYSANNTPEKFGT